jgi:cytochrome c-type biogenesis protein
MFDISFGGALLAGLLSFLTHCILPFYLGYLAGAGVNQLAAGGSVTPAVRLRAVLAACLFSAGVIAVFVALGASATIFGQLIRDWFDVLRWVAAAVIIAMGLHFLGVVRIGFLYRQFRAEPGDVHNLSLAGAFVIGLAFAFGWTPCVGPVLAAILFTAAGQQTAGQGACRNSAYGMGMTIPFVLAAVFVGPIMRFMARFRRHLGAVEKVIGAGLVLFGVLIATNSVNWIAQWLIETFPIFSRLG